MINTKPNNIILLDHAQSYIEKYIQENARVYEIMKMLSIYTENLIHANLNLNLIAKSTINIVCERHIMDGLFLAMNAEIKQHNVVLDLGTGSGIPGIISAIIYPQIDHLCLEKSIKKTIFLKTVVKKLGLQNVIFSYNIEDIKDDRIIAKIAQPAITARAFKSLLDILVFCDNINKPTMYLLKGKNYQIEIDLAKQKYHFDTHIIKSYYSDSICLTIKNICSKANNN